MLRRTQKNRSSPLACPSHGSPPDILHTARGAIVLLGFVTSRVRGNGIASPSDRRLSMPEKKTRERARKDAREGKAPSTQAGEYVREEMEHIRKGKHGARSAKQAIAIGLSKARRAGVHLRPPKKGAASDRTRAHAARDYAKGRHAAHGKPSRTRSRAISGALRREGRTAASHRALSRQAHASARSRSRASRSRSARKAARTRQR